MLIILTERKMETTMFSERTLINLHGFCLYCLGKIDRSYGTGCSPIVGSQFSSPCTPLKNRFVHSLPLEERVAPFVDLCRYMNIDIPDKYSFGDGSETETLTPPLCHKCHELSSRLCMLQEELQYIQMRINNTVRRIYKRVHSTCGDQRRGALKREAFQKEFRSKSKGGLLSRGRAESSSSKESKKVLDLLKSFQMKVLEKDCMDQPIKSQQGLSNLFAECQSPMVCSALGDEVRIAEGKDVADDGHLAERGDAADYKVIDETNGSGNKISEFNSETDMFKDEEQELLENEAASMTMNETKYMPSETLHWATNTTIMDSSSVVGGKGIPKLNSVDAYRQEIEALRNETGDNSNSSSCSCYPVHGKQSLITATSLVDIKSHDQDKIEIGNKKREAVIDSTKVTDRAYRLRTRRCLLMEKKDD